MTLTCFDSHHGRPVELVDFSHDPAVLELKARSQHSMRITGKLIPESCDKFSPFIIDIDSFIDVYVQYGRLLSYTMSNPGVVTNDLFHLFNTLRVIHNFTASIWSEHDHRAVTDLPVLCQ